jgi:hypothetical protein
MDITAARGGGGAGAAPDGQINSIDFGWLVSFAGLPGAQSCPRLKTSFASHLNWIPRFKPLAQNISISFFQK